MDLAQEAILEQSLHISSTIQDTMDCNSRAVDAVEDPVGLESDFPKLRDADILKFRRNATAKRQRA